MEGTMTEAEMNENTELTPDEQIEQAIEAVNESPEEVLDDIDDADKNAEYDSESKESQPKVQDSLFDEQEPEEQSEDDSEQPAEEKQYNKPAKEKAKPLPPEVEADLEGVVEALLFASESPLTALRIVGVLEAGSAKHVNQAVKALNKKYQEFGTAFRIEKIAGGYRMMTLSAYNSWLQKLIRVKKDDKLTPATLETLAIISYKQPIIRADIEAIRGVASGEAIRSLMYKGLVKIVGRAEVIGRPMLYGTTKKFLDVFGLNTLKDLPQIEELQRPE